MAGACKKAQGAALWQAAPAPGRAEGSARRPERPQEPPPWAFLHAPARSGGITAFDFAPPCRQFAYGALKGGNYLYSDI